MKEKAAVSNTIRELDVLELRTERVKICIKGMRPLIYNAMSAKAKQNLLLPRPDKMNATEKMTNVKHSPLDEYRSSVYRYIDDDHPTRLCFPAAAFKKAAMNAALRLPAMKKTEIGQLLWVNGDMVDLYGIPQLKIDVIRMAG